MTTKPKCMFNGFWFSIEGTSEQRINKFKAVVNMQLNMKDFPCYKLRLGIRFRLPYLEAIFIPFRLQKGALLFTIKIGWHRNRGKELFVNGSMGEEVDVASISHLRSFKFAWQYNDRKLKSLGIMSCWISTITCLSEDERWKCDLRRGHDFHLKAEGSHNLSKF